MKHFCILLLFLFGLQLNAQKYEIQFDLKSCYYDSVQIYSVVDGQKNINKWLYNQVKDTLNLKHPDVKQWDYNVGWLYRYDTLNFYLWASTAHDFKIKIPLYKPQNRNYVEVIQVITTHNFIGDVVVIFTKPKLLPYSACATTSVDEAIELKNKILFWLSVDGRRFEEKPTNTGLYFEIGTHKSRKVFILE